MLDELHTVGTSFWTHEGTILIHQCQKFPPFSMLGGAVRFLTFAKSHFVDLGLCHFGTKIPKQQTED